MAEALFDLANMFAAAEPVLEAEEAATSSPPAPRHDSGHRAKRARGAKGRGSAAAATVQPYQQSTCAEGRFGRGSGHAATAAAPGPSFQEALARQPQADAAVAHDYGMVAAQLAAGRGGEWDRHGSANGLVGLAGKGSLVNGGGFAAPNGLPAGLAGFYQPGALPQGLGAGGGWPGGPADERGAPEGQLPSGFGGDHRFPRCASHVYIAHFIEYQSKLERQRQVCFLL